jgi:hypothetical protein
MAMLTEPNEFQSGAALRSVTDWAHYNHGYTGNILISKMNPIAYKKVLQSILLIIYRKFIDASWNGR